jgi:transposase
LYDLLKPHVTELLVCNPRKIALLKDGSKSDRIDAHKLADLLYMNKIKPVYHGEHGLRMLKELSRSYLTITKDLGRVMNRLKALYRSWAIPCAGTQVYAPRFRSEWLRKITEAGVRRRAELYYQQLDALRLVRQQARKELLAEARKHRATKLLRQIPGIGPLRAAHLVAVMQTPHRFAPSGNCGPTAGWGWRPTTARSTASWSNSYNARRNPSHCGVSIRIITTTSKIFSRAQQ